MHSTNKSPKALAIPPSKGLLVAITPPNAEIGSDANAIGKASAKVLPEAIPHGERCLTMTTVGASNETAPRQAASRSSRLL